MSPRILLSFLVVLALIPAGLADPHSFGNPGQISIRHLELDLSVDFDRSILEGSATLTLVRRAPTDSLVLDSKGLVIKRISQVGEKTGRLGFSVSAPSSNLGSSLTIDLPQDANKIRIEYQTTPDASALQWLGPEQTEGKKGPFLFTQSQAIHARSWIPCIDSPAVRMTYDATIRVDPKLVAVMSAETVGANREQGVFRFRMRQPIPSYLIALSVGVIDFRDISPRVRVYAEPEVVEKAAYEFADTEKMMKAAEELYGPYRWERYDMIVLPPSFPFGGMENPRLTFLTPTVLSGDRTLVDLVAHELAHSWSGNLVTNASWGDLWINEGFTVYLERRIMEKVFGADAAKMNCILGLQALEGSVKDFGGTHPFTKLAQNLYGHDPDDAFSDVPYEKGALLLHRLEGLFGRERLDQFLRSYFDDNAFRAVTTPLVESAIQNGLIRGHEDKLGGFSLKQWLYGTGLPEDVPRVETDGFTVVDRELEKYRKGTPAVELAVDGWITQQWLHFLRNLPKRLSVDQMTELDKAFSFTGTGNSEIFFDWAQLSLRNHYKPAFSSIKAFLLSMGRMKFVGPLFGTMVADKKLYPMAREIYELARPGYHPIGRAAMDKLLEWE